MVEDRVCFLISFLNFLLLIWGRRKEMGGLISFVEVITVGLAHYLYLMWIGGFK
jgi:hypothetical protein